MENGRDQQSPTSRSSALRILFASIATGALFVVMIRQDLYIGSPYPAHFPMDIIPQLVLAFYPGGIFAFFAIWPTALAMVFIARWLERRWQLWAGWPAWLTVGILAGGPAMYLYSFPLGFGRDLMAPLLLNGAICGLFCAAMTRALLGPDIIETSADMDHEPAGGKFTG